MEMERRASLDQVVPGPAALKDVSDHRVNLSEPQGRPGLQAINVLHSFMGKVDNTWAPGD